MDLLAEVKRIVHDVWLDGPTAPEGVDLGPDTRFVEDLEVDSLAVVEMVIEAEAVFEMDLPDGEYDHVRTVQDAVDYLERKLAENVHREEKDGP